MAYIKPKDVHSPKSHWKLVQVVHEGGAYEGSYALGHWDNEPRIGFRWNGSDENPIGNPQSRGLPTWTMLEPALHLPVIQMLSLDKQMLACSFLGIGVAPSVELKISAHPSGRYTLMRRFAGQRMHEDYMSGSELFGNLDKGAFFEAVCREVKTYQDAGTRVILDL